MSDPDTTCTLNRHKDGRLAIRACPEIFLCSRSSIEMMVDNHNQAIAAGNDARAEIQRHEQFTSIAEQTIKTLDEDLRNTTAQRDQLMRERDAIAHDIDELRADVKALLTETEHFRELHAADHHIEFTRRKIAFFDKHQEMLQPRHEHESNPRCAPKPDDGTQDPTP